MTTLLVTNDFPPKVGGIQSYLWELWRRLPPDETVVLTAAHRGAPAFDAAARPLRIDRVTGPVLLPTPGLRRRIDRLAAEVDAGLVLLDPALPLGLLGPRLERPYGLVLHGAEITVPGRLPVTGGLLGGLLRAATHVVSAGSYPLAEGERAAGRALPATVVPPGVDPTAYGPLEPAARARARHRFDLPLDGRLVVSLSRLVPRKGMDVLIRAAARLAPTRPDLTVAIAGSGRDRRRLERLVATTDAPVRLLGRISEDDKADLYGSADLFAMLCRNRWMGLEQEGFGIVFLEAAAAGLPVVAGASGGADEAVEDGDTGVVVRRPGDPRAVADALASLLDDPARRRRMGEAGRARAEQRFGWDGLAADLREALVSVGGRGGLG